MWTGITRLHPHTCVFTWLLKLKLKSLRLHSKPFPNWPASFVPVCSLGEEWNAQWPGKNDPDPVALRSHLVSSPCHGDEMLDNTRAPHSKLMGPDMPSHSSKSRPYNSSSLRQSEDHAQRSLRKALGVPLVFVRVKSGGYKALKLEISLWKNHNFKSEVKNTC